MYLVRRKPTQRAINRYCGDQQSNHAKNCCHPKQRFDGIRPGLDIYEDKDNLYIAMELPGLVRDDVNVSVDKENLLKIKGMKKQKEIKANEQNIRQERTYGEFERSFKLKSTIDSDKIEAEMSDGVLKIVLPKHKPNVNEINID
jgi:HSP20 family protein